MRTLLCKFNHQHFSVKNAIILCSFTFTAKENRKSHLQLSNLQCCHLDIVTLRVAINSNVQNVRLHRRQRPTDDAYTHRWHGSQQTGSVRTTRRSDAHEARLRPRNK